jgi:hypothetical protein
MLGGGSGGKVGRGGKIEAVQIYGWFISLFDVIPVLMKARREGCWDGNATVCVTIELKLSLCTLYTTIRTSLHTSTTIPKDKNTVATCPASLFNSLSARHNGIFL